VPFQVIHADYYAVCPGVSLDAMYVEFLRQFSPPLECKESGRNDENPLGEAAEHELLYQEAGHDGFA